jgi:hypothetical protein
LIDSKSRARAWQGAGVVRRRELGVQASVVAVEEPRVQMQQPRRTLADPQRKTEESVEHSVTGSASRPTPLAIAGLARTSSEH